MVAALEGESSVRSNIRCETNAMVSDSLSGVVVELTTLRGLGDSRHGLIDHAPSSQLHHHPLQTSNTPKQEHTEMFKMLPGSEALPTVLAAAKRGRKANDVKKYEAVLIL